MFASVTPSRYYNFHSSTMESLFTSASSPPGLSHKKHLQISNNINNINLEWSTYMKAIASW